MGSGGWPGGLARPRDEAQAPQPGSGSLMDPCVARIAHRERAQRAQRLVMLQPGAALHAELGQLQGGGGEREQLYG